MFFDSKVRLTRLVVVSGILLAFAAISGRNPVHAGEDPFDLRPQLEREAGIVPRRDSLGTEVAPEATRSGGSESRPPLSGERPDAVMISVDEEPEEPPPIRLRLVRGANRVEVVQGDKVIRVFPVSVGKPGWETPLGVFQVLQMELNPEFRNPFDVTDVRPALSPRNPLGPAWIGFWSDGKTGIGFHGTNLSRLQPSHGCVRMHNRDVMELYSYVSVGTVVEVR